MWGECPSVDGRWACKSHEPEDGRASTMHGRGELESCRGSGGDRTG